MTRWWFVRHGQSVANAGGWLSGHRDVALTALGVAQARALRARLAEVRPARVWSSDLDRALSTARLAWGDRQPEIATTPHLRERHLGAWEGAVIADLHAAGHFPTLWSWGGSPPGGESHRALSARALAFLARVDDGHDTLVFAHGGLIRCVLGLVDGVPVDDIGRNKVANVEVAVREVERGTWARLHARL